MFDLDRDRAERFAARYGEGLAVTVADKAGEALAAHPLVCLATTAGVPHTDLAECRPGTLVLHLSLRDVSVDGVLAAVNITDDADHVCRAATSLHLAEQQVGHREFIAGTLGGLLSAGPGRPPRRAADHPLLAVRPRHPGHGGGPTGAARGPVGGPRCRPPRLPRPRRGPHPGDPFLVREAR